jgi:hypothetical protein
MFNKQFINKTQTDLISGKIHTIRKNYEFWKNWDGKEVSIRVWEDKPYHSKQIEICKKKIMIQRIYFIRLTMTSNGGRRQTLFYTKDRLISRKLISQNDGFMSGNEFNEWFMNAPYPDGHLAVIHFTDFRY